MIFLARFEEKTHKIKAVQFTQKPFNAHNYVIKIFEDEASNF